ncbi:hypothetical protein E2C01_076302 [Portunus trituberculatus]|uniref:Uncharacterized protein n=1 Tax=Portunus trituberculatus TaxID=210409 RepID=A0A5B7IHC7_PORTR|nr:hypothetical protein [Portunus trituberculatus]
MSSFVHTLAAAVEWRLERRTTLVRYTPFNSCVGVPSDLSLRSI